MDIIPHPISTFKAGIMSRCVIETDPTRLISQFVDFVDGSWAGWTFCMDKRVGIGKSNREESQDGNAHCECDMITGTAAWV